MIYATLLGNLNSPGSSQSRRQVHRARHTRRTCFQKRFSPLHRNHRSCRPRRVQDQPGQQTNQLYIIHEKKESAQQCTKYQLVTGQFPSNTPKLPRKTAYASGIVASQNCGWSDKRQSILNLLFCLPGASIASFISFYRIHTHVHRRWTGN